MSDEHLIRYAQHLCDRMKELLDDSVVAAEEGDWDTAAIYMVTMPMLVNTLTDALSARRAADVPWEVPEHTPAPDMGQFWDMIEMEQMAYNDIFPHQQRLCISKWGSHERELACAWRDAAHVTYSKRLPPHTMRRLFGEIVTSVPMRSKWRPDR